VIEQSFASFDDYWAPFLTGAGRGGAYVVSVADERRRQLEARIRTRLLGNPEDGPFVLKARAWCVRGEFPRSVERKRGNPAGSDRHILRGCA